MKDCTEPTDNSNSSSPPIPTMAVVDSQTSDATMKSPNSTLPSPAMAALTNSYQKICSSDKESLNGALPTVGELSSCEPRPLTSAMSMLSTALPSPASERIASSGAQSLEISTTGESLSAVASALKNEKDESNPHPSTKTLDGSNLWGLPSPSAAQPVAVGTSDRVWKDSNSHSPSNRTPSPSTHEGSHPSSLPTSQQTSDTLIASHLRALLSTTPAADVSALAESLGVSASPQSLVVTTPSGLSDNASSSSPINCGDLSSSKFTDWPLHQGTSSALQAQQQQEQQALQTLQLFQQLCGAGSGGLNPSEDTVGSALFASTPPSAATMARTAEVLPELTTLDGKKTRTGGSGLSDSHSPTGSIARQRTGWSSSLEALPSSASASSRLLLPDLRRTGDSGSPHFNRPFLFYPDGSLHLDFFKVYLCKNESHVHDRKNCPFFHSQRDRRRFPVLYRAEQCEDHFDLEGENTCACPNGDGCDKCHNRHELLYHPGIYKQRFCSSYNYLECHRGKFCAFAHARIEIRCQLFTEEEERCPTSEFFMLKFKTLWCPYGIQHDWHGCLYAHTYQDCRRSPQIGYGSEPCPYWQKDLHSADYQKRCPFGPRCPYSHGSKEQLYHPAYYKTMPCADYKTKRTCPRGQLCAFYHDLQEKRPSGGPTEAKPAAGGKGSDLGQSLINDHSASDGNGDKGGADGMSPGTLMKSLTGVRGTQDYLEQIPSDLMVLLQSNFMRPPLFNLDDFEAFGHASRGGSGRRPSGNSYGRSPQNSNVHYNGLMQTFHSNFSGNFAHSPSGHSVYSEGREYTSCAAEQPASSPPSHNSNVNPRSFTSQRNFAFQPLPPNSEVTGGSPTIHRTPPQTSTAFGDDAAGGIEQRFRRQPNDAAGIGGITDSSFVSFSNALSAAAVFDQSMRTPITEFSPKSMGAAITSAIYTKGNDRELNDISQFLSPGPPPRAQSLAVLDEGRATHPSFFAEGEGQASSGMKEAVGAEGSSLSRTNISEVQKNCDLSFLMSSLIASAESNADPSLISLLEDLSAFSVNDATESSVRNSVEADGGPGKKAPDEAATGQRDNFASGVTSNDKLSGLQTPPPVWVDPLTADVCGERSSQKNAARHENNSWFRESNKMDVQATNCDAHDEKVGQDVNTSRDSAIEKLTTLLRLLKGGYTEDQHAASALGDARVASVE